MTACWSEASAFSTIVSSLCANPLSAFFLQEVKVNWATTPSSQKKDTSSKYAVELWT